jgi:threonyl-tRNA synthetase
VSAFFYFSSLGMGIFISAVSRTQRLLNMRLRKKQRPVMIHRAILGSFERFIAILLEHTAGDLPTWLSPIQVRVIPVGRAHRTYASHVLSILNQKGVRVEVSPEHETVGKSIREGEVQKIPYLVVVGDREIQGKTVSVRERHKKEARVMPLETFVKNINADITARRS